MDDLDRLEAMLGLVAPPVATDDPMEEETPPVENQETALRAAIEATLTNMSHEEMAKRGALKKVLEPLRLQFGKAFVKSNKQLLRQLIAELVPTSADAEAEEPPVELGEPPAVEDGQEEEDDAEEPPVDLSTKKRKKKAKKAGKHKKHKIATAPASDDDGAAPVAPEHEEVEEELSVFDWATRQVKFRLPVRSTRNNEEQLAASDRFIQSMRDAADKDDAAWQTKQPAVAKLLLLPRVQQEVAKTQVVDILMQSGLLRVIKRWLEPTPDGGLPNIQLRSALYVLLSRLPIGEQALEQSEGLGRRLLATWKDERETDGNVRLLDRILCTWMAAVLGVSTQMTTLAVIDNERAEDIFRRRDDVLSNDASSKREKRRLCAVHTRRILVPKPALVDYAIRPQQRMDDHDDKDEAEERADAAREKKQQLRRMNEDGTIPFKRFFQQRTKQMRRQGNQQHLRMTHVDISGRHALGE
jgi:hypothetical protein